MEQWIKFTLVRQPFHDRGGNVLPYVERRNVYSEHNENYGGEWLTPDLTGFEILERCQKEDIVLMKIRGDKAAFNSLKTERKAYNLTHTVHRRNKKKIYTPKETNLYNLNDFGLAVLTDEEAEAMKEAIFGIIPLIIEPDSGVT